MRTGIALALGLMLAACGGTVETEDAPANAETDIASLGGDQADGTDVGGTALIPARFHGVWDFEDGTCARESDLRLDISGDEIMFYEAIGTVTGVTEEGDDVNVTLAMQGEGETWEQQLRFSLVGSGADIRLHQSDGAQEKYNDDFPSKKCDG